MDYWLAFISFVIGFNLAFVAGFWLGKRIGFDRGFEAGEDHALPPRGPKGRFQKTK